MSKPYDPAADPPDPNAWLTPGRFAAILALLITGTFPLVVCGYKTFFFRDYGAFGYPLAFYHREAFWQGRMPLWNPLNCCGLPFLAQWNTLALYPGSLIYLIFPLSWSLGIFNLAHMFFAGIGMYFLARRWTGNSLAAAVAATAYAFNGLTWHCLMWPNNIAALGWMPWVVLAAERAWREGGRWLAPAALAGGVQMLAGAPEVILLTWVATGVLCLADVVGAFRKTPDETEPVLGNNPSPARMAFRLTVVVALVAGVAAAQLLPFARLLSNSQRDTAFSDAQWSMPASGLADYLVPLFHCFPGSHGVFSQRDQYWTSSYYAGIGAVALALFAVWRVRSARAPILMVLAAFSLLMANGPVYALMKHLVPPLGVMRFPIKFVVLATFVIPLIAALAVAWLQRIPSEKVAAEQKKLWWLGGILIIATGLILVRAWLRPIPGDDWHSTWLNGASRVLFLALILGCVTALRPISRPIVKLSEDAGSEHHQSASGYGVPPLGGMARASAEISETLDPLGNSCAQPAEAGTPYPGTTVRAALDGQSTFQVTVHGEENSLKALRPRWLDLLPAIGLLLLLWLDVLTHAPNLSPTVDRSVFAPDLVRQYCRWGTQLQPGISRLLLSPASVLGLTFHSVENPEKDFIGRRVSQFSNCNLLDKVAKCDGFYSLYLPPMQQIMSRVALATNDLPGLRDFLGVSHFDSPANIMEFLTRPTYLPVITGGQDPVFADDATVLQSVTTPAFDPRRTVYLPAAARGVVTARGGQAKILSSEFLPERVTARVDATGPSMVVIAQAAYAPWHAYVDGKPVPLWRANYAFQALEVPAGRHDLAVVYEDTAFKTGAVISITALGVCALIWGLGRRKTVS